jgi:hypothetical protein
MRSVVNATVNPRRVLHWLLGASLAALFMHTVLVLIAHANNRTGAGAITGTLNLGLDAAVPTWFASALLLATSIALLAVWSSSRGTDTRNRRHWLGLAAVFGLLSIDEVATIHERWGDLGLIDSDQGLLYYGWVVTAIVLLVPFVLAYLPFLGRLEPRTARLFVTSGCIFVGGAIGVEMMNAALDADESSSSLRYWLQTGFEEFCELVGASLFLYAVLDVLTRRMTSITVGFAAPITGRTFVQHERGGATPLIAADLPLAVGGEPADTSLVTS